MKLDEFTSDLRDSKPGEDVSRVPNVKSGQGPSRQAGFWHWFCTYYVPCSEPQSCPQRTSGSRDGAPSLAVWPQAGCVTPLSASPHVCDMGITGLTLPGDDRDTRGGGCPRLELRAGVLHAVRGTCHSR